MKQTPRFGNKAHHINENKKLHFPCTELVKNVSYL